MRAETPHLFGPPGPVFNARLADGPADVRLAQRLRYEVFAGELHARLPSAALGIDSDPFDPYCDHLLVRDQRTGRVVGTYRMLSPARAARAGGWYCESGFDVAPLAPMRGSIVEIGRACVDPAYRGGAAIAQLWAGVLRYVIERGCEFVIGCASIGTSEGGHVTASLCRRLLRDHLAPPEWRVVPWRPFFLEGWDDVPGATLPPLIKGYLRLGARVCGEPAWDADFQTADFLMVLPVARMNPRYVNRLLRAA